MILHAKLMIYEWWRLATLRNWLMNALLSPSRKKEAEGNVRAALWLSSPQWAEPPAILLCGAWGPGVSSPGQSLVPQHTCGPKELPIHSPGGNWSLCMCLDPMITLAVQPLEEQTWRNSGERNSHLSAGQSQISCTSLLRENANCEKRNKVYLFQHVKNISYYHSA